MVIGARWAVSDTDPRFFEHDDAAVLQRIEVHLWALCSPSDGHHDEHRLGRASAGAPEPSGFEPVL